MLQTSLLLMKRLSKAETPIFYQQCVLYFLFSIFYFISFGVLNITEEK